MSHISRYFFIYDVFLVPVVTAVYCVQDVFVGLTKTATLDYPREIVFAVGQKRIQGSGHLDASRLRIAAGQIGCHCFAIKPIGERPSFLEECAPDTESQ